MDKLLRKEIKSNSTLFQVNEEELMTEYIDNEIIRLGILYPPKK